MYVVNNNFLLLVNISGLVKVNTGNILIMKLTCLGMIDLLQREHHKRQQKTMFKEYDTFDGITKINNFFYCSSTMDAPNDLISVICGRLLRFAYITPFDLHVHKSKPQFFIKIYINDIMFHTIKETNCGVSKQWMKVLTINLVYLVLDGH